MIRVPCILRIFFFTNGDTMRKLIYGALGVALLLGGAGLHYAVPRVSVVQIVGVEVKRVDGETGSRDVYMIQSQDPDTGRVRVFRNEDALLYLKMNSADLQARVTAFSRGEPPRHVAVRHYGWRIPIFSVFPNAISAWVVEPGYRHVPVFNVILLLTLLGVPGLFFWRRRSARKRPVSDQSRAGASTRTSTGTGSGPASTMTDAGGYDDWSMTDRVTVKTDGSHSDTGHDSGSGGGSDA
jgi:hypothetical protein